MAVMSAGQRLACRDTSIKELLAITGLVKADLAAAVNAIDQWVSDNATAFNTSIPQPARNALTASQKAALLEIVVRYRYQSGV